MEAAGEKTQSRGVSWEQYASCESMSRFDNLESLSDKKQQTIIEGMDQNLDKRKQKQTSPCAANAPAGFALPATPAKPAVKVEGEWTEYGGEKQIIRCICGATAQDNDNLNKPSGPWIACHKCGVWQHNMCVGMDVLTKDPGALYSCEKCSPQNHKETLEAMERGEKPWEDRRRKYEDQMKRKSGHKRDKAKRADPSSDHSFGHPSPLRYGSKIPLWVPDDPETTEATPPAARSLDDLYREHPEKRLRIDIESSTMNLAAAVILQVVNESVRRWLDKWCPQLNLRDVFEATYVKCKTSEFIGNPYKIPHQALDTSNLTTSLANMYNGCRNVHPKGSGDISFSKLLMLVDTCVVFMGVLKDDEHKSLLLTTRSTFQCIPIRLDRKKHAALEQARAQLRTLNGKNKVQGTNNAAGSEALERARQAGELAIIDTALTESDTQRKILEIEVLEWLNIMLASTARSPSKPDPAETIE